MLIENDWAYDKIAKISRQKKLLLRHVMAFLFRTFAENF
jgi:hypothetical protein